MIDYTTDSPADRLQAPIKSVGLALLRFCQDLNPAWIVGGKSFAHSQRSIARIVIDHDNLISDILRKLLSGEALQQVPDTRLAVRYKLAR